MDYGLIKKLADEYVLFSKEEWKELSRKWVNDELSEEEEEGLAVARMFIDDAEEARRAEEAAEAAAEDEAAEDPMNIHPAERFEDGEAMPSREIREKNFNRRVNAMPPSAFEMFPLRGRAGSVRLPNKAARWEIERRMVLGSEASDAEVALLVVAARICPVVETLLDTSKSDEEKRIPFEELDAFDSPMWKAALLQTREIMAAPDLFDPDEFIRRPLLCMARSRGWRWWTRRERGESAESLARRIVEDIDRIYGPLT